MNMHIKSSLSPEIASKIKQIEIRTKRLLKGIQPGDSRSAQKGMGFDFDQIREYQMGDDIRFIDWSGSARTGALLVKQYTLERSRTILIAVDISASGSFSSEPDRKSDTINHVASALALIAEHTNDNIGLLLFSSTTELYIPPRKGITHVREIIRILFTYKPKNTGTCFETMFKKLISLKRKDTIVFVVSDFIGELHATYCKIMIRLYSLIAIRCLDKNEQTMPSVGFLPMIDIETGEHITIDTHTYNKNICHILRTRIQEQNMFFQKHGINILDTSNNKPFISDMVRFFKRHLP